VQPLLCLFQGDVEVDCLRIAAGGILPNNFIGDLVSDPALLLEQLRTEQGLHFGYGVRRFVDIGGCIDGVKLSVMQQAGLQ